MRAPTPSAPSKARANVVLPAPSGPARWMTPPSRTRGASARATRASAASSMLAKWATYGLIVAAPGVAQNAQMWKKIAGDHACFAVFGGCVAGLGVQSDTQTCRAPRVQALREQPGDDAGERVAHTAAGHSRIAPRANRYFAVRMRYQRAG